MRANAACSGIRASAGAGIRASVRDIVYRVLLTAKIVGIVVLRVCSGVCISVILVRAGIIPTRLGGILLISGVIASVADRAAILWRRNHRSAYNPRWIMIACSAPCSFRRAACYENDIVVKIMLGDEVPPQRSQRLLICVRLATGGGHGGVGGGACSRSVPQQPNQGARCGDI